MDTKALTIIDEARRFLGVRFRHQGRSITHGVDCLGLIMCVAKNLKLTCKSGNLLYNLDERNYSKTPNNALLTKRLSSHLEEIELDTMQASNIALIEYDGNPQHLAIITQYEALQTFGCIHAFAPARKVVEHRLDAYWKNKITNVYRV